MLRNLIEQTRWFSEFDCSKIFYPESFFFWKILKILKNSHCSKHISNHSICCRYWLMRTLFNKSIGENFDWIFRQSFCCVESQNSRHGITRWSFGWEKNEKAYKSILTDHNIMGELIMNEIHQFASAEHQYPRRGLVEECSVRLPIKRVQFALVN